MTLTEIYEQQQREKEQFNKMRDQAWKDLQDRQQAITAAFGSREKIPEDTRKQMDKEVENYRHEWSTETGQRYQEMQQHHEKQREAKTGVKPEPPKAEPKPKADELSEKQAKMQKIIAQQQAIRAKQQQKKRSR